MGQTPTFQSNQRMSALPPIADVNRDRSNVRFVPKGDVSTCSKIAPSLDHLVGEAEQRCRNCQSEGPGGFEIDHELDFGGLLHRQIGWFLASPAAAA